MTTLTWPHQILPENYRLLQQSVYSHTGIVLDSDKEYLLQGRLAPLVKQLGLTSINELCGILQEATHRNVVGPMVAEALTTNETFFFREPQHYQAIRRALLPKLIRERRESRKLRFWSAASSTGQEAYSLAMLLVEEGLEEWDIQIMGSDYSRNVVERAESGTYQQIEVNRGLPASLLVRFFTRLGVNWQISPKIRGMTSFEKRDLRENMQMLGPFDLVFCRNVMIYFDLDTRLKIIRRIHGVLNRGGWLLLGGAECSIELKDCFEKQRIEGATVYVAR